MDSSSRYRNNYPPLNNSYQNQKYIIPIQQQYSVLNHKRDPYHMFDRMIVPPTRIPVNQMSTLILPQIPRMIPNEQAVDWRMQEISRNRSLKNVKNQIKQLHDLMEKKERDYEMHRLISQIKTTQMRQISPSYSPMFMPMPFMPINPFGNGCNCHCNCRCRGRESFKDQKPYINKRYNAVNTENAEHVSQVSILPKVQPVKPVKAQQVTRMTTPIKKQKIKPKVKRAKKQKKKLLNRFRICAYAIYFSIFLKYYSLRFSINRYNSFRRKFLQNSNALVENNRKIYYKILDIDIIDLIKQSINKELSNKTISNKSSKTTKFKEQKSNRVQPFDIKKLLKEQNYLNSQTKQSKLIFANKQQVFLKCSKFIISLLSKLAQTINDSSFFDNFGQGLTVGSLNQSFVLDNRFLPHQILFMKFHSEKGYINLNEQSQKALLVINVLIKLLIYNVCLQLDNNKQWHDSHLKAQDEEITKTYFVFLEVATKILYIICQQIYEQKLSKIKGTNYEQIESKFKIEPCNPLVYAHTIKKRRQLFKNQNIKDSNLIIYGIQKLDQVNQIMNQDFFIKQANNIKNLILKVFNQFRLNLKEKNRQIYKQIKQQTLNNQYIVFNGIKINEKQTKRNLTKASLQRNSINDKSVLNQSTKQIEKENMRQTTSILNEHQEIKTRIFKPKK